MIKFQKQFVSILLTLVMCLFIVPATVSAADTQSEDIVILYTNDVHTYIDGEITYSKVAALKDSYENVLLLDAGDHLQGTAYGSMDNGETIVKLMNAADYDVATLGNHEFDYGMSGCMQAIDWAEFPYVSCNFRHMENGVLGENVLDSYALFEVNNTKIAVIGIATPETITSSTPSYFQDEKGNYIYGIAGGEDGAGLYEAVQGAIDSASQEADVIIALGHLGDNPFSTPWRSEDVISNTSGLDAFIDGHSHSTIEMKEVADKDGNSVILTQTGEYLNAVGKMTISANGITTELLTSEELANITPDAEVKAIEDAWISELETTLGEVIGSAEVTFDNYDSEGKRLVRQQETNSGDFATDALYYLFDSMDMDVDVAIMNGGGIRNQAITGDISYLTCKEIHTFGNVACLLHVTGQQILDALEWGARSVGISEEGSFLHVSGLTYQIDTSIPNTTQADNNGVWTGGPTGEYRVHDVKIYNKETNTWDDLDLNADYNLAGYNYTLCDLGGGFAMFEGGTTVLDYVMEDYMVLANYVKGFADSTIKANNSPLTEKYAGFNVDYSTVNGSGRIVVEYPIWVGGVQVSADNADDVLQDGTVSYDAATNTLTLNCYQYEGDGYLYGLGTDSKSGETEYYSAAIYSSEELNIQLIGQNQLKNTFSDEEKEQYGDGIVSEGDINITGTGNLLVSGYYGIDAEGSIKVTDCTLVIDSQDFGIGTFKDLIFKDANVSIDADGDGIYVVKDMTITDSTVNINAKEYGIYVYDGSLSIICTRVGLNSAGYGFVGTSMNISAGEDCYALKVDIGNLKMDDNLTISVPEKGNVKTFTAEYDGTTYNYDTIVDSTDAAASSVNMEPLVYEVSINGLSYSMMVPVPVGKSVNEVYCAEFGIKDFSELMSLEKEGYTFGGWYTDEACIAGKEYSFDSPVTSNITIYAKWVANTVDKPADSIPEKGDNNNMWMWSALIVLGGAFLLSTGVYSKKRCSS